MKATGQLTVRENVHSEGASLTRVDLRYWPAASAQKQGRDPSEHVCSRGREPFFQSISSFSKWKNKTPPKDTNSALLREEGSELSWLRQRYHIPAPYWISSDTRHSQKCLHPRVPTEYLLQMLRSAVQSTSATLTSAKPGNSFLESSSQVGARFLQWPHLEMEEWPLCSSPRSRSLPSLVFLWGWQQLPRSLENTKFSHCLPPPPKQRRQSPPEADSWVTWWKQAGLKTSLGFETISVTRKFG